MSRARGLAGRVSGADGFRALRHRNDRLFFAGQAVSLVGTWMMTVALSWLVLQLTGDPFMLGVVAAAQFLPVLLLGLFGGIVADGLPKRRTLVVTQGIAAVLSLTLFTLAVTGTVQVWQIVVLALIGGVRNAVDLPTRQAFAVELVGREDIGNAVALNSALFNGARVVGPAIAGIVIGLSGVALAFLIDAVSFVAVLAGLLLMREEDLQRPSRTVRPSSARDVLTTIADGLRYVRRTDLVLLAILVVGLVMGWIAAQSGVAEAFVLGGLACTGVAVAALAWLRRRPASAAPATAGPVPEFVSEPSRTAPGRTVGPTPA